MVKCYYPIKAIEKQNKENDHLEKKGDTYGYRQLHLANVKIHVSLK